jgi:hypothetical protein
MNKFLITVMVCLFSFTALACDGSKGEEDKKFNAPATLLN